ncbi:DNA mismatch repair protein MutH [Pasteurella testudinis DSM 23072]|uniref:DNA mismatch repair protein MutH n=1 Tax=Pasteurella testudinis DSM 23072 TaxID=1122938 RepID=A0A1W1UP77_9PAST|nr:DNA mismatch repair endonuclease MutH [Pasteurella testudinis]SMB82809.1 DNA mismatch repair protein MutH [Pasteurella testudinis DSM 23072]SUB52729.1 DNA mismatch repair protein MutH [Pasteurella testudinis]
MATPQSESQLLQRARRLAGLRFADIAAELGLSMPQDLKRNKGWVGMLLETALGAEAGSKPQQDFSALGIELKTIPVNRQGYPLETTFVSLAPLTHNSGVVWQNCHVRYKLQKVLWIPVEGERAIPLAERRVGSPILWQPDAAQEARLAQDWEELMDLIVLGEIDKINATIGEVLQLRPKGANSKAQTLGYDAQGQPIRTLPLGFYLRKNFTAEILQNFCYTSNLQYEL